MKIPSFMRRHWWERPYIDLWTIPHTLMGALVAAAAVYWGWANWVGPAVVIALALVWELIEHVTGISRVEAFSNKVSDVVAAVIGYGLGLIAFRYINSARTYTAVVTAVILVDLVVTAMGWAAYRIYVTEKGRLKGKDRRKTKVRLAKKGRR